MHFLTKKNFTAEFSHFFVKKFSGKICDKKVTKFCSKNFFCQKMHFYGITVVIISKLCEVMKSETKIVLINYNTHVHTLSKKIIFFELYHYP